MQYHKPEQWIIDAIFAGYTEGSDIVHITQQLTPKQYQEVKKTLNLLGCVWDRGLKTHKITDPKFHARIQELRGGQVLDQAKTWQQFDTPDPLARHLVSGIDAVSTSGGNRVLEPSAGTGNLLAALRSYHTERSFVVRAVEIDPDRHAELARLLSGMGFADARAVLGDFTALPPKAVTPFDYVLMNPPYTRGTWLRHLRHAASFLAPGGVLRAVLPNVAGAEDLRKEFPEPDYGLVLHDCPPGLFAKTAIAVRVLTLYKASPGIYAYGVDSAKAAALQDELPHSVCKALEDRPQSQSIQDYTGEYKTALYWAHYIRPYSDDDHNHRFIIQEERLK